MNITIRVIPHSEQRYETVGDWIDYGDRIEVLVSDLGDWRHNALIGIHEVVEALLCKERGITTEMVDAFDKNFEADNRRFYRGSGFDGEPGDHPEAPYCREHFFATTVERLLAAELGVDWQEYDDKVNSL